ncbi:GGDEF domain-containing protein [Nocardioides daeguensis]|nr:GGDEF domain-containing protein [Nocardioides daeguensis]MBV6726290.1 GGDEF domain-containing protein [Nocardioides daeguensis]MCR1772133.1 GGDEF domain-containing protein [Nocardioides daeguensis]
MNAVSWMQPRNHRAAARSVSTLCAVGAGVAVLTAPLQHEVPGSGMVAAGGLIALVVAFGVLARRFDERHRLGWALGPLAGVVALTAIDLLTQDSGVSAQVFFLFPALYGASQLRPPGAAVITGASVAGELVVVLSQLPAREALVDALYVTTALITTAVLLAVASERHARTVAQLELMATVDPLTGLFTRRVLDEAATAKLSDVSSGAGTALVLIDIDHFKTVNDEHGHPAGDEVLIQLAALLLRHSRPTDVVCRLGGDEVAVLLPGCGLEAAVARAEEILAAVRSQPFVITGGAELTISISLGCAHMPTHGDDLRSLYAAADAALYEAKQAGRGRVGSTERLADAG